MDKKERRAKEIMANIRQILLMEWDPIGIKDVPETQDEYDFYIGGVYRLLVSNSAADQIARHLAQIEKEQMGLHHRNARDLLPVAQHLLSLDIHL